MYVTVRKNQNLIVCNQFHTKNWNNGCDKVSKYTLFSALKTKSDLETLKEY